MCVVAVLDLAVKGLFRVMAAVRRTFGEDRSLEQERMFRVNRKAWFLSLMLMGTGAWAQQDWTYAFSICAPEPPPFTHPDQYPSMSWSAFSSESHGIAVWSQYFSPSSGSNSGLTMTRDAGQTWRELWYSGGTPSGFDAGAVFDGQMTYIVQDLGGGGVRKYVDTLPAVQLPYGIVGSHAVLDSSLYYRAEMLWPGPGSRILKYENGAYDQPFDTLNGYTVTNLNVVGRDSLMVFAKEGTRSLIFRKYGEAPMELVFEVDSINMGVGQFVSRDRGYMVRSWREVWRTTDGGWQWELLLTTDAMITAIHFLNDTIGLVTALSDEVHTTWDGGNSWEQTTLPYSSDAGWGKIFDTGVAYVQTRRYGSRCLRIYRRDMLDHGYSWSDIMVAPNPSDGVFEVRANRAATTIEVRDLVGRLILRQPVHKGQATVDLSTQAVGTYVLVARSRSTQAWTTRVVRVE